MTDDTLRAEIHAGHQRDKELTRRLDRPAHRAAERMRWWEDPLQSRPLHCDQATLIARAQDGDAQARAALVAHHMPLIARHARRYRGVAEQQELIQEGVVGLLRALERYDLSRGPLEPYAGWWIRQAMQQLVAEISRPVQMPERSLRALARIHRAEAELRAGGEQVQRSAIARRAGVDLETFDALTAAAAPAASLDAPTSALGELLTDPLADDVYGTVLAAIEHEELHRLIGGLSERERTVLRARFGLDGEPASLRALGERLGLSAERIRQIERRALDKLHAMMA